MTTGGSTPAASTAARSPLLRDAVPWAQRPGVVGATTASSRATTRCRTSSAFDDILLELAGAEEGTSIGDDRERVAIPVENVHPFRTSEAIGEAADAEWCAPQIEADELRDAGLPEDATAGRSST